MMKVRSSLLWAGGLVSLLAMLAIGLAPVMSHSTTVTPVATKTNMNNTVSIEVGESPDEFSKRYGSLVKANKKNFGVEFYKIRWNASAPGAVTIKTGNGEFQLGSVLSVMGTYDGDYPAEGLSEFSVNFGLVPEDNIPHDVALHKFYELLARIQQAGWRRWIEPELPRLDGQDALRYQSSKLDAAADLLSLDPNYPPKLDDWMHLKDMTRWQFYQHKTLMTITLMRDQTKMAVDGPGDYFIAIEMQAESTYRRESVAEEERQHWADVYPATRKSQMLTREQSEAKLAALGFKIDTTYKNPDNFE